MRAYVEVLAMIAGLLTAFALLTMIAN